MNYWTEERVERVKELWDLGQSCSMIAKDLGGGITRCAIIGKVHRLGLEPRATAGARTLKERPTPKPRPKAVPKEPPAPVVEEPPLTLPDGSHVTILTVTDRMCRWPIGDPSDAEFHFCGRSPKSGAPYCEAHCRRAYQPQQTAASRQKSAAVESAIQDRQMRRMVG